MKRKYQIEVHKFWLNNNLIIPKSRLLIILHLFSPIEKINSQPIIQSHKEITIQYQTPIISIFTISNIIMNNQILIDLNYHIKTMLNLFRPTAKIVILIYLIITHNPTFLEQVESCHQIILNMEILIKIILEILVNINC